MIERHLTWRDRCYYLAGNAFELFICLLALIACVQFFENPNQLGQTAVGHLLHPWDYAWNSLYGIGSLLVVCGLVVPSPRFEVAGLCMFSAAVSINAVAIFTIWGTFSWSSTMVYLGLVAASFVRIGLLIAVNRSEG